MLRAMALGDYLRYRTVFPTKLNELIILITARHFSQQYEWYVHYPIAVKEGLSRDIADAIADGRRPTGLPADEQLIYDFCTELLQNHSVSDPTYARAVARFGEQGTIEMVGVVRLLHVSVDGAEHGAHARAARSACAEAVPEMMLDRRIRRLGEESFSKKPRSQTASDLLLNFQASLQIQLVPASQYHSTPLRSMSRPCGRGLPC